MLRWISLALVLAASGATLTNPSLESKETSDALSQCRGLAWVRAPDMVPGDVITGDVKVKLMGPCADAESYTLGLRYKERIFWKLNQQDVPLQKILESKYKPPVPADFNHDLFQVRMPVPNNMIPYYDKTEWMATVHEEERVAFEIKTALVGAEEADPLPTNFTTRFGILVPNTNYPPGVDYRMGGMGYPRGENQVFSESIYEYFVEIKFSNGTTSEIPAGITAFAPFYLSADNDALHVNVSLARGHYVPNVEVPVDILQSNYTIEVSLPDGAQVYQNSSVNMMATIHRTGYTNRTDTPMQLCAYLGIPTSIEWHPRELKNRSTTTMTGLIRQLVPSKQNPQMFLGPHSFPPSSHSSSCGEIKFATIPVDLTQSGHISSTSSEPLSLSFAVNRDAIPDFSTYYQKLKNHAILNLHVRPDSLEPWEKNEFGWKQWEKQTAGMDETDLDWVPWLPYTQTRHRFYEGNTSISVLPVQTQGHLRSTPVHYLSDEARQPVFVDFSDIVDLRLMSPEERDLIAPLAQPYMRVFANGEELYNRYFTGNGVQQVQPIYVGDTWFNKVLSVATDARDSMYHSIVVQ